MNWEAFAERYSESINEHMMGEPEYQCKECEEIQEPLVVRVKVFGEYRFFKCCPECGEELEMI